MPRVDPAHVDPARGDSSCDTLAPTVAPGLSGPGTSLLDLPARDGHTRSLWAGVGAVVLHGGLALVAATAPTQVMRGATHVAVSELIEIELPAPVAEVAPEKVKEDFEAEPTENAPQTTVPKAIPSDTREAVEPDAPTEEEPPPASAEAGEVLTAKDEIVDFGDTIISSSGDRFAGGLTSADGTSKVAVRNPNARPGGVTGGKGSGRPVRLSHPVDQFRSPRLAGGAQWDCPFPAEADMERIDSATVSLRVEVGPSGTIGSINVLTDPGHGFGREARRCALSKRWDPGLDLAGQPATAVARIQVHFRR